MRKARSKSASPLADLSRIRAVTPGLALLFLSSGALALVYEILWQRQFAVVFGSAAPATAAVLAAYFAGLGAGSLAFGSIARRCSRPLRVYALLELAIGAGAALVPLLLAGFERIYPLLFDRFSENSGTFFTLKTVLAFAALALPTFCMGGTLPVLGQLVDEGRRTLGQSAGLLYVANTAGAGLGALAVPFLMLPLLGAHQSIAVAVAGNVAVAVVAWRMDRRLPAASLADPSTPAANHVPSTFSAPGRLATVVVCSFLSGLVTFLLQVLWTRAFAQVHENSVYSFGVIVALFVFALAAGAQVARSGLHRGFDPRNLLGAAWIAGGFLVTLGPALFLKLTHELAYLPSGGGWSRYGLHLIGLTCAVLLVPVTLLGIGFPAIMELAGRHCPASPGQALGRILAANVVGSVAGALLGGFVLPHWMGLWQGMWLTAGILILAGASQCRPPGSHAVVWQFRALLLALVAVGAWMAAHTDLPRARIAAHRGERLVSLAEGTHGVVAVVDLPDSRRIKLNNHYVLGGSASTGDERVQTHLPLLLHPAPRRTAVLGLGTGITASGALFHPVESITVAELVPEVMKAARTHFADSNASLLDDPRVRVIAEDGRNLLRGSPGRFDVIVGDLVVPWHHGESALFTIEQFRAARAALTPGGLYCQWIPLYQLSEPEFQILLRTFLSVFPSAVVLRGDFLPEETAIALVGGVEPFSLNPADIRRRQKELRPDPLNPHLAGSVGFWMYFAGIVRREDVPAGDGRINSENRPWIELIGPMRHAGHRDPQLCTGRRLQAWLAKVRDRTANRLSPLDTAEQNGLEAGELLFEFGLARSEGKHDQANAAQQRLKVILPRRAYEAIFPTTGGG